MLLSETDFSCPSMDLPRIMLTNLALDLLQLRDGHQAQAEVFSDPVMHKGR